MASVELEVFSSYERACDSARESQPLGSVQYCALAHTSPSLATDTVVIDLAGAHPEGLRTLFQAWKGCPAHSRPRLLLGVEDFPPEQLWPVFGDHARLGGHDGRWQVLASL